MLYLTILFLVIIIAFPGVDAFLLLKPWSARIKIGKWQEKDSWRNAVEVKAQKWLYKTPVVKQTDNSSFVILDILKGKYKNPTIQSWQKAALLLGCSSQDKKNVVKSEYIDESTGNWKEKPKQVDFAMMAYAILREAKDAEKLKPAMDEMLACILDNKNEQGYIAYRKQNLNLIYVDTLGFICPFLVLYGICYHQEEYIILALKQIRYYKEYAVLEKQGLPVHAYDMKTKTPLGIYGWGRGLGWYMLALIDSCLELETKKESSKLCQQGYEELKEEISHIAEKIQHFQHDDGGFSNNLPLSGYDSSITAVAGYFYKKCTFLLKEEINEGMIQQYYKISDACITKLMNVTRRDGSIDFSQGDTKGIGAYATTYDIMPFTQGMALRI